MQLEERDRNIEGMKRTTQTFRKLKNGLSHKAVCMITWVNKSYQIFLIKLDIKVSFGSFTSWEQQHIPALVHMTECVCVCLNASLLKGSYVLMRCKWLQEVVSHSLNGTPPHLWSPDFWGSGSCHSDAPSSPWPSLENCLWWEYWQACGSLLLSPLLPLTSFSLELFVKDALRNRTACHMKRHSGKVIVLSKE